MGVLFLILKIIGIVLLGLLALLLLALLIILYVPFRYRIHASYYDNNWLVMMMKLDRHKDDFDVERVKDAIFNTKCFEPIHLSKYGELYFINGGGNHRVCQAKFLGLETVPCEVTEFVIEK